MRKPGDPVTAAYDLRMPPLGEGPAKIGSRKPNAFGLYDLAGNVEEWCAEWGVPLRIPSVDIEDEIPVPDSAVRGGSAYTEATDCQATHASQVAIIHRLLPFGHVHQCHQVGFRVCIPIDN